MNKMTQSIERAILSTILFSHYDIEETTNILELLKPRDFEYQDHQIIFSIMVKINDEELPIDEQFIIKHIKQSKKLKPHLSRLETTLIETMSAAPIANVPAYVEDMKKQRVKRDIEILITKTKKELLDDVDPLLVMESIENMMYRISNANELVESITMTQNILEYENSEEPPKIGTGISPFDEALYDGIELHQLVHIGGESGAGKTMLTLQILNNVSKHFGSLFLSFEMPKWKIAKRLTKYKAEHSDFDNYFILDRGRDISEIKRNIKKDVRKRNIKFVVIDSEMKITHRAFKGQNEANKLGEIQSELSALCQELGIVIFLITQLSKEDIRNKSMSGLGSVKSDYEADMKILISKDENNPKKRKIQIKKNRQDVKNFEFNLFINTDKLIMEEYTLPSMEKIEFIDV